MTIRSYRPLVRKISFVTTVFCLVIGRSVDADEASQGQNQFFQFEKVLAGQSRIGFINRIAEDEVHNFLNYTYVYNGGGVAVGDINNDGLPDLYFSGNQVNNTLYLNEGAFVFREITGDAFSDSSSKRDLGWKNGVTMVDINNDGWLDIYVCRSGLYKNPSDRKNLLYINNGDLTFSEQANAFGLNDPGFSIQAYFFDYDRDNDLDMFLINHRYDFENNNLVIPRKKMAYNEFSSDKLYRNNGNGSFTNVTQEAGLINYAWGLSAAISDFNNDGWDDIYIANDYVEPDHLYINNQEGTFREGIASHVKHVSYYSMGSDVADINNDGFQDLIVLDMAPEDHVRAKRLMTPMSTEDFWRLIENGLHYQYMLNTLQLNHGNGLYSEIAQLSGVSKTDWSWAPLFADFDNDGFQDLFVTNGIRRDITDNDFFDHLNKVTQSGSGSLNFNAIIAKIPMEKLQNYIFRNQGDLTFKHVNKEANLTDLSNSNGAAYADLNGDGALDLVINNIDEPATVYKNLAGRQTGKNHLKVKLRGQKNNYFGVGATVSIHYGESRQTKKMLLSRGYLSSVEPVLHFGLGHDKEVPKITVTWSDGHVTSIDCTELNKITTVHYEKSQTSKKETDIRVPFFDEITAKTALSNRHNENVHDDFSKEVLLPHKQSEHGPYISVGDVNGDGLEDFFIGAPAGASGKLYMQTEGQHFIESQTQPWSKDLESEDLGSLFFDFDNDGDLDLYVVCGGNEHPNDSVLYQDRLYLNDGKGTFIRAENSLPNFNASGLRVVSGDYDNDGDADLFVGGRSLPGRYPLAPNSYLLKNERGKFIDVTDINGAGLRTIGMVTDASFVDHDNDGDLDLMVVGEWMPITLFENRQGDFVEVTDRVGLAHSRGWWFTLAQGDLDKDGDIDFIAGNIGQNNKYQPTQSNPLTVHASDFDNSGTLDIVLSSKKDKQSLPIRGRQCSSQQMPSISQRFPSFRSFAEADISAIYSKEKIDDSFTLNAALFSSSIIINKGTQGFEIIDLPIEAQFSPISGIVLKDFNMDGHLDILFAGNVYGTEVETVRYDAGIGGLLLGDGQFSFSAVSAINSGFVTPKNARDLKTIRLGRERHDAVLVSNNDDELQVFKLSSASMPPE